MDAFEPTEEQQNAIRRRGRFVLRACPGSGKTFVVAHRTADRLRTWPSLSSGMAVLSFTNVACEEIEATLGKLGTPKPNRHPHFLGTLDSFIDTFIFLPFGHRVMGCASRPKLVGFNEHPWVHSGSWAWGEKDCNTKGCNLKDFSWNLEGELIDIRPNPCNCPLAHARCEKLKQRFVRAGYATQTDAAYWAAKVLQAHPTIARALVRRFPEMIIDEAQDTSHAQMRVVDLLVQAGLNEVVLVGDPDQAIYEWRTAHPELLTGKMTSKTWAIPSRLTASKRNSQLICDAVLPFSSLEKPARGHDGSHQPRLWFYDEAAPGRLLEPYLQLCTSAKLDLTPGTVAVLARGHTLIQRLLNLPERAEPWLDRSPCTELFARAAVARDRGKLKIAWGLLKTALSHLPFAPQEFRDLPSSVVAVAASVKVFDLLRALPSTALPLRTWMVQANAAVHVWLEGLAARPSSHLALPLSKILPAAILEVAKFKVVGHSRSTEFLDQAVITFFEVPKATRFTVETIHAAKGKTYDAVMLVLAARGNCTLKALSDEPPDHEALRTAYVAMTRPRHLLVVAVPKNTKPDRLRRFHAFRQEEPNQ